MRLLLSRMLSLAIASAALLGTASAQPTVRDHREKKDPAPDPGDRRRRPPMPPMPTDAPREAPPAPRAETVTARPGFVWVTGRWDWKAGKWEWVAGHWERERAGKRWREGRWERQGDVWRYVNGEWIPGDATPPGPPPGGSGPIVPEGRVPPPGPPPGGSGPFVPDGRVPPPGTSGPIVPEGRRPPRVWKLERPVIASYWPARGKVGSQVVIRGKNFPKDATVLWAGQPVRAARVADDRITFKVPAGATTGALAVQAGGRRPLPVGTFEVAAAYDPVAEAKKLEEERRRKAEEAWREREKQLAKDRAAREAAWRQREAEREATRAQRRAAQAAALRARWDRAFLADPETQDELTLHAQRVAELVRMREVAELSNNGKLVVRVEIAQSREDERHEQRMAALKAAFGTKGGMP